MAFALLTENIQLEMKRQADQRKRERKKESKVNKHAKILHCTENPIYVFLEMKLRGLVPNSYIHVSVSNLYIPMIGLSIWLQVNRQT